MSLALVPRSEVRDEAWDACVAAHPEGWWFHTSGWLAYALAYDPGCEDRSLAVVDEGGAVRGLAPLLSSPTLGGQPYPSPLLPPATEDAETGDLLLAAWAARVPVGATVVARPQPERDGGWWPDVAYRTRVVDLRQPEAELWQGVRKSYRSLIRRTERHGLVSVYSGPGWQDRRSAAAMVDVARTLHLAAAGRATRGLATWGLMGTWATLGHGLIGVASRGAESVGYAYVLRYKDWAYYASGAALEPDVQHGLIWALVDALRHDGQTHHFELGREPREGDSDKERSIAFFKQGFGGLPWVVHGTVRA